MLRLPCPLAYTSQEIATHMFSSYVHKINYSYVHPYVHVKVLCFFIGSSGQLSVKLNVLCFQVLLLLLCFISLILWIGSSVHVASQGGMYVSVVNCIMCRGETPIVKNLQWGGVGNLDCKANLLEGDH